MNRGAFIKNIAGCIIGYALLPKQLTEQVELKKDVSGIDGEKFVMSIDVAMFNPFEIIQDENGMQVYVISKEEGVIMSTGQRVKFKDFKQEFRKVCSYYGETHTG